MSTTVGPRGLLPASESAGFRRIWARQLPHYPDQGRRMLYLGVTVLATITLYYELYIQGAVATKIISQFNFTFTEFVFVLVVGNAVGAFASLGAGLADRWGRANLVVGGILLTGLLTLFALPNATSRGEYMFFFALLSMVEGMALVATPALIRDFSPQLGRGVAMGFWTMGPVLGSLVVTEVSSHTLGSHPGWQYQFHVCGIVGLVVWAIAFLTLRELSPQLRDQLMVSIRDRALVEARAAGIKPEELEKNHWRQMLRPDIVGPALGVSLFLLAYYIFVAFLVVYFSTVFGYSEAKANDLANWYWIANAIALVVAGIGSDRLKVRKPFMIAGAVVSLIGLGLFAAAATRPHTSYHTFAFYFVLVAGGSGVAYVGWMSAFTETVEKHNPAATATGLAVWGWIIRLVVTASFAVLTVVVPATNTLVNQGPKVEAIAAKYAGPIKTATVVGTPTLAALKANPANQVAQVTALARITGLSAADVAKVVTLGTQNKAKLTAADLVFLQANGPKVQAAAASLKAVSTVPAADFAYLQANAAKVQKANKNNPGQWQTWWWICFFGQLLFIPFVFLLTGRWSPKRASEDEAAHEALVASELERLHSEGALSA